MDVSVILVNYNTELHLKECLNTLFRFTNKVSFEVIVVDNNSPNREIENFPALFPDVKFYFRDINKGFGDGCNFGASKSSGKYVIFVNPDIKFDEDILTPMSDFLDCNPNTGACSPVLTNFKGELIYTYNKFPNYRWEFFEFLGKGNDKFEQKLLNHPQILNKSKEPLFVDWMTGACFMIRKNVFEELKGFDDDYFLYYEDTDLQKKIHDAGYKIACLPYLRIKHFVNSSVKGDEGDDVYYYHLNRSKMLYFYKHFNFFKRNILRTLMITGIILRMTALNFRKRYSEKRKSKMNQYKKILKIFFSTKFQLLQN